MATQKTDIYVYAHWVGLVNPVFLGILVAHQAKGRRTFSFECDKEWLKTNSQRLIDPDIQFYSGQQFPNNKENFGIFLDSMPDTWGRTLMKRQEAQLALMIGEKAFYDILDLICKQYGFEFDSEKMLELAREIKKIVDNAAKYPDWADRDDIKAQLKMDIIVKLHQFGYPPITQDDVYKNVLEQAENFKKNR